MANKNNNNRFITIFLIYGLVMFAFLQMWGRKNEAPTPVTSIEQQARDLEAQADNPQISVSDRVKKLEGSIAKYRDLYHQDGSSPAGINARYQEIRLLNRLALENSAQDKGNTSSYDQAETLLKDMQSHLAGKSATVALQPGQPPVAIPDVGADAARRLGEVRAERGKIYQHDLRFKIMDFLVNATGRRPWFSYWFALVALTVFLKTLLWPFNKKQFAYMRDMQRIAPLMKDLQERMKGRPAEEIQKKTMELQKEHNINMTAGCLPMVLQAVVLIPVFYMVRMYEYQFSHGYFLWIGSELSHRFPQWIGPNLASFDVPMFVLYMGSTVIYSLLQPKPADPAQVQQQKMMMWMMPLMFGYFMWIGKWSSAFMFYWLVQNLVSMAQNWMLLRHFGPPPAPTVVVAEGPIQPMQAGPNTNGNGRRPPTGRVHSKKKKKGSRA